MKHNIKDESHNASQKPPKPEELPPTHLPDAPVLPPENPEIVPPENPVINPLPEVGKPILPEVPNTKNDKI